LNTTVGADGALRKCVLDAAPELYDKCKFGSWSIQTNGNRRKGCQETYNPHGKDCSRKNILPIEGAEDKVCTNIDGWAEFSSSLTGWRVQYIGEKKEENELHAIKETNRYYGKEWNKLLGLNTTGDWWIMEQLYPGDWMRYIGLMQNRLLCCINKWEVTNIPHGVDVSRNNIFQMEGT
jgi:hypothetical protein